MIEHHGDVVDLLWENRDNPVLLYQLITNINIIINQRGYSAAWTTVLGKRTLNRTGTLSANTIVKHLSEGKRVVIDIGSGEWGEFIAALNVTVEQLTNP